MGNHRIHPLERNTFWAPRAAPFGPGPWSMSVMVMFHQLSNDFAQTWGVGQLTEALPHSERPYGPASMDALCAIAR